MNTNDSEDIDFWTEHERANDYIQKCLIKGQEKCAMYFKSITKSIFLKLENFCYFTT